MNHWLVFAIPASLLAILALLTSFRFAYREAVRVRPLSQQTSILLEEVNENLNPPPAAADPGSDYRLPLLDAISIYVSSRRSVTSAHRLTLQAPTDPYLMTYRDRLEADHSQLCKLLIGSMMEAVVNKTFHARMQQYSRASLWIYAEEAAILTEMSDCFQDAAGSSNV